MDKYRSEGNISPQNVKEQFQGTCWCCGAQPTRPNITLPNSEGLNEYLGTGTEWPTQSGNINDYLQSVPGYNPSTDDIGQYAKALNEGMQQAQKVNASPTNVENVNGNVSAESTINKVNETEPPQLGTNNEPVNTEKKEGIGDKGIQNTQGALNNIGKGKKKNPETVKDDCTKQSDALVQGNKVVVEAEVHKTEEGTKVKRKVERKTPKASEMNVNETGTEAQSVQGALDQKPCPENEENLDNKGTPNFLSEVLQAANEPENQNNVKGAKKKVPPNIEDVTKKTRESKSQKNKNKSESSTLTYNMRTRKN